METNIIYNSNDLKNKLKELSIKYPFLQIGSIGLSVLNNPIYYIRIGNGDTEISYSRKHTCK